MVYVLQLWGEKKPSYSNSVSMPVLANHLFLPKASHICTILDFSRFSGMVSLTCLIKDAYVKGGLTSAFL